jgi:UPF0271 protein
MSREVDLNCDCGESFGRWQLGDDARLMDYVSSVNIACGFHAGDPVTMKTTVELALARGIAIGAHPGLPDLLGFGRRVIPWSAPEAFASVAYQVGALAGVASASGATLHHVKLHGVLPGMVAHDQDLAAAVVQALLGAGSRLLIYSPASRTSAFHRLAREAGLTIIEEVYADMQYDADGEVVPERVKRTVPTSEAQERVRLFLHEGVVDTLAGTRVHVEAQSISLHGDAPNAAAIAAGVRAVATDEGVLIAAPDSSTVAGAA